MATIVVKQDGSGDYTTIAGALAAASRYDIVEIQDSNTYSEGNLSRIQADITIRAGTTAGGSRYTPVMDGGGTTDCAIKFYNNWVIDGLHITGYDGTATSGAGLVSVAGTRVVTIRNCTIHDLDDSAIAGLKAGSVVENCTIYDIRGTASRGIDSGVESATITNCLIYDVQHDGIQSTPAGTTVQHCTLYNVGYGRGTGGYGVAATLGTVQFCIVADPDHNLTAAGIRASTHSYNCVSGSDGSTDGNYYGGAGTGDLVVDPLLISGTFRLSSTSPCMAAAVGSVRATDIFSGSLTWQYSHKVNGVNSGVTPNDMGAFEAQYTSVSGVNTNNIASVQDVAD